MNIVVSRWHGLLAGTFVMLAAGPAAADFTVSQAPTRNVTCNGGVCMATAAFANLNVRQLHDLLGTQDTTLSSGSAPNIDFYAPLTWATPHALTIVADNTITVHAPIVVAGPGAVTLSTHYGPNYVILRNFTAHGRLEFLQPAASSLTINGAAFTLVNSLHALAAGVAANPTGLFALAGPVDASQDGAYTTSPVPTLFNGVFEGLGNAIDRMTINANTNTYVGLFSTVFFNGVVDNLRLTNVNITAASKNETTGALAGTDSGALINDSSSGRMSGVGSLAGLVGYVYANSTPVTRCSSSVSFDAPGGSAGGLFGSLEFATISQSYATGQVRAGAGGGLVGSSYKSVMTDTYATGAVIVPANSQAGGLLGSISDATLATSYSTGRVNAPAPQYAGGLIGFFIDTAPPNASTLTDDYWDVTTSRQAAATGTGTPAGITGLTSAQLQSGLPAGFNPGIWAISPRINGGYPYLLANPPR